MLQPTATIDLEEVVRVLVSLGIDEPCARQQLSALPGDAERLNEAALLAVESDAAVLLSDELPLPVALFELADGLRQAGLAVSLGKTATAELALRFSGARTAVFELSARPVGGEPQPANAETRADVRDVVRALTSVVPRSHQLLLAAEYEQPGALPVLILDRGTYVAFSAAVGDGLLERVFVRAGSDVGTLGFRATEAALVEPNFAERYRAHPPPESATDLDVAFERVRSYDPRVPWAAERTRPPGDDFYDLCHALSAAPFARCLTNSEPRPLAQLLYRFGLTSLVGAQCDMLATRRNPGLSAQGVLGWGQLTWAFFIFDALGANAEAEQAGALLEHPWVMAQERGVVALRQRAYYDLARWLRSGVRGASLGKLPELLALSTRAGWQDAAAVTAAVAAHSEPIGDQITHHPLYFKWPATLYALARRAGALDLLPKDNPFLARPLTYSMVDLRDPFVVRLREQLQRLSALDPEHLPPLLDPLPVIVDVAITHVDGDDVHGHTLLAAHDDAEHHVVAPSAGRVIRPGEVWLLEIQGALRSTSEAKLPDIGAVRCTIALPTGEWLEKA